MRLQQCICYLRQGEELQQKLRERYNEIPYMCQYALTDNAIEKYLFAALLEKRGDYSNASILYKQTAELTNGPCAKYSFGQELNDGALKSFSDKATVLLICHNGNSPRKVSTVTNASLASTVALEIFLSSSRIPPAYSCLGGIPTPAYVQGPWSEPRTTYSCIDGTEKTLQSIYDVSWTACNQLEQKMPSIVARGVARYLLRRTAVGYAECMIHAWVNLWILRCLLLMLAQKLTQDLGQRCHVQLI